MRHLLTLIIGSIIAITAFMTVDWKGIDLSLSLPSEANTTNDIRPTQLSSSEDVSELDVETGLWLDTIYVCLAIIPISYQELMANKNLNKAKEAKKDEFYTQLEDINNELRHYREHFRCKTVLCNCDDPRVSNFFKYFAYNFEFLGLKKLIATCYKNQDVNLFSEGKSEQAVYLVYEGDKNGNHMKFLIIGHQNAIKYKEIFPLIQNNQLWLGYGFKGCAGHFISNYEDKATAGDHREGMIRVSGVTWFTAYKLGADFLNETLPEAPPVKNDLGGSRASGGEGFAMVGGPASASRQYKRGLRDGRGTYGLRLGTIKKEARPKVTLPDRNSDYFGQCRKARWRRW